MTIQLQVYRASASDETRVLRLLHDARRSFAAFGFEDLPHLLATGNCMVAGTDDRLWAFMCVSVNQSRWAYLRGAAITDGWRTDDGLNAVLPPLVERLRRRGATHLATYGTALWIVPALMRAGFERLEWIVNLERHAQPWPENPPAPVTVRAIASQDLPQLCELDSAAFDPPYQLASGELIELMVTSGYFAVAVPGGQDGTDVTGLAGYVCADVVGDTGQVIRLAVHPGTKRQGIGSVLLNHSLAYCHEHEARRVLVNTQESNTASLKLYGQFGFRRVGRRIPLLVQKL